MGVTSSHHRKILEPGSDGPSDLGEDDCGGASNGDSCGKHMYLIFWKN